MDDTVALRLIEQYENLFIRRNTDIIEKLRFGFIEEDCSIPIISIVIHCMENLEIFDNTQLNNIQQILSRLNYV